MVHSGSGVAGHFAFWNDALNHDSGQHLGNVSPLSVSSISEYSLHPEYLGGMSSEIVLDLHPVEVRADVVWKQMHKDCLSFFELLVIIFREEDEHDNRSGRIRSPSLCCPYPGLIQLEGLHHSSRLHHITIIAFSCVL
ncbi:hypothetical protein Tco_0971113 [Tanacetum coccineum]